jgi:hypothetical protein
MIKIDRKNKTICDATMADRLHIKMFLWLSSLPQLSSFFFYTKRKVILQLLGKENIDSIQKLSKLGVLMLVPDQPCCLFLLK